MSNEEENIDKIFNELIESNSVKEHEFDKENVIKELLQVQESLGESLLSVNSIIYYIFSDASYTIPDSVNELLGPLFKISEDFLSHLMEINGTIEVEMFLEDELEEEEDGESE
jgi:spore coat polysaccharide biosynthesis protein SpsF (cytidylyltransferase family)